MIYAGSIVAIENDEEIEHRVVVVKAQSEDEANEICLQIGKKIYPDREIYTAVLLIPKEYTQ